MPDDPDMCDGNQWIQRREDRLRGLQLVDRHVSTELHRIVRDVRREQRTAELTPAELGCGERLCEGDVFEEPRSRRRHFVGDVLLVGGDCNRDWSVDCARRKGDREPGRGDGDCSARLVNRLGDLNRVALVLLPPSRSQLEAGYADGSIGDARRDESRP